ncbi:hypothetical protein HK097_006594 [Rhizophlyctis rosea]|uniref:Uncharacterized protein n=1 Tax=Rhizophlyctis rosea TaxID=64517 RepID=A0AAD5SEP0_9FUNG|nr:hypothetical protein HK097_006594 [Rhizophlyctis rosea]
MPHEARLGAPRCMVKWNAELGAYILDFPKFLRTVLNTFSPVLTNFYKAMAPIRGIQQIEGCKAVHGAVAGVQAGSKSRGGDLKAVGKGGVEEDEEEDVFFYF